MNIIFDLGGVVLNWDPTNLVRRITPVNRERELLITYLFKNPIWRELDRGIVTIDDVAADATAKSGLDRSLIEEVFNQVPTELFAKDEMVELIEDIAQTEHKLYVLSNMPKPFVDFLLRDYNFWHHFEGIVFSCDINMIKPDKKIFNYLFDSHNISADDSLFIDDTLENIEAAQKLAIESIHFTSLDALKDKLKLKGII